jgi:ADP-heptose:LPS heptosyltransferase
MDKLLEELNNVDAWLYKFGINYKKINEEDKYNVLDLINYKPQDALIQKLDEAKRKGKLLLFHPYSANINKSIPQATAIDLLKELLAKADDYMIITTLQIDSKIKEDNYIDLSKESKTINDFIYIISNMDKVITTDTSTYHISDAFMIPTVAFFTDKNFERKIKYYKYVKPIFVKDKTKNLSKFIYENEKLTIYKSESWRKLKIDRIIKLLENF